MQTAIILRQPEPSSTVPEAFISDFLIDRRFAVFNASSEIPTDTEEAVNFWINKVCCTVQNKEQKGSQVLEGESKMKVWMKIN